jgi:hypothetical protein
LPATVVEQLGLGAGSPFPGHSLATFWSRAPGQAPPKVTPALSELVGAGGGHTFQHQANPGRGGFQMSLMTPGWHYLRDGTGPEQIYDLSRDMGELENLVGSARGQNELGAFRRMLLDTLTDSPGSTEVENAYLKPYRQQLESLVRATSAAPKPTTAAVGSRRKPRSG